MLRPTKSKFLSIASFYLVIDIIGQLYQIFYIEKGDSMTKKILGIVLVAIPLWFGPFIYNKIPADFKMGWYITCIAMAIIGIKLLLEKYLLFFKKLTSFLDKE